MKYYCKNCKIEYRFPSEYTIDEYYFDGCCLACGNDDPDYKLIQIPDYETPEQYEKRTGEAYSEERGLVFLYHWGIDKWQGMTLREARHDIERIKKMFHKEPFLIVIADPPVPPPDDWRPND